MADDGDMESRLAAVETLVAFMVASQHMQSPDPAAAGDRFQRLLLDQRRADDAAGSDDRAITSALELLLGQVHAIQAALPRRMVDG